MRSTDWWGLGTPWDALSATLFCLVAWYYLLEEGFFCETLWWPYICCILLYWNSQGPVVSLYIRTHMVGVYWVLGSSSSARPHCPTCNTQCQHWIKMIIINGDFYSAQSVVWQRDTGNPFLKQIYCRVAILFKIHCLCIMYVKKALNHQNWSYSCEPPCGCWEIKPVLFCCFVCFKQDLNM